MKNSLLICVLVSVYMSLYAQKEFCVDSCLYFKEGYIIKTIYHGKEKQKVSSLTGIDYFFFKNKPSLDSFQTPETLYFDGGQLLDYNFLFDINIYKTLFEGYKEFDHNENKKEIIYTNSFKIEIYKVQIVFFKEVIQLNDFVKKYPTSHSYYYLYQLPKIELQKKIEVMQPVIIKTLP